MTPVIAIFDDFLPEHLIDPMLKKAEFSPCFSPVDNVTYQGISTDIPEAVARAIEVALLKLIGDPLVINYQFIRLMTRDHPRSEIHADHAMGEFSLHVYLNEKYPHGAGTQFWINDKWGQSCPQEGCPPDTNRIPADWTRGTLVWAKYNRALVHESKLWHSAQPARGFGWSEADGRIVLTTFFSRGAR